MPLICECSAPNLPFRTHFLRYLLRSTPLMSTLSCFFLNHPTFLPVNFLHSSSYLNCSLPFNTCYHYLRQLVFFRELNLRGCLDMDFGEEKKGGEELANSPNQLPSLLRFVKNHHLFARVLVALLKSTIAIATANWGPLGEALYLLLAWNCGSKLHLLIHRHHLIRIESRNHYFQFGLVGVNQGRL